MYKMGLADGCKIVVGSRTSYKNGVIISDPAMFVKVHKFHLLPTGINDQLLRSFATFSAIEYHKYPGIELGS